jgi:hypothetical protein
MPLTLASAFSSPEDETVSKKRKEFNAAYSECTDLMRQIDDADHEYTYTKGKMIKLSPPLPYPVLPFTTHGSREVETDSQVDEAVHFRCFQILVIASKDRQSVIQLIEGSSMMTPPSLHPPSQLLRSGKLDWFITKYAGAREQEGVLSWGDDIRDWIEMVHVSSKPQLKQKIREDLARWTKEETEYRPNRL